MRISIGILAWNEGGSIGMTIGSIFIQRLLRRIMREWRGSRCWGVFPYCGSPSLHSEQLTRGPVSCRGQEDVMFDRGTIGERKWL